MAWTGTFSGALRQSVVHLRYRLVAVGGPDRRRTTDTLIASEIADPTLSAAQTSMGRDSIRVEGESLQIPQFTASHGGFSCTLVLSSLAAVASSLVKGTVMALEATEDGGGAWNRVALGILRTVRVRTQDLGVAVEVDCDGFGALLAQRYTDQAGRRGLFRETHEGGQLDAAYTAGDGTLTVDDTSAWSGFDTAGIYYIRAAPLEGSVVYLRATGRTATTFTGVTGGVFGTTDADLPNTTPLGVARGTQLGASYTAADTTVTVDETDPWDQLDGDGVYYLRIYPSSGDPFVLRATGTTATTFTSVATSGRLGTTAVNASVNDEVQLVRVVQGHPHEIAYKVLSSTGAGTNGAYDVLPADWGLALSESLLNPVYLTNEIADTQPTGGDDLWEVEVPDDTSIDDAGAWLEGILSTHGSILTLRQGDIVPRALRKPRDGGTLRYLEVDDGAWVELEADWYDGGIDVVYRRFGIASGSELLYSTEEVDVAPAEDETVIAVPDIFTGVNAKLQEIGTRIAPYYHRQPANLRGLALGMEWSELAPGEEVLVSSTWLELPPPGGGDKSTRVNRRPAVVVRVDPEWDRPAACRVELLVYPEGKT